MSRTSATPPGSRCTSGRCPRSVSIRSSSGVGRVLYHRDKGIYQPLQRPYFSFENNRGPETIVQELDGTDGPEYQVFLGGYRDPVTGPPTWRWTTSPWAIPPLPRMWTAMRFVSAAFSRWFVMRSGDEVLYISTKYSVSVGPNGAGGMSHQVTSYPDFYRYRFKALAEKVGGPVEVALDFQTGWVWVIPVLDGAPDPSRIAIAIFHSANDSNAPRIRGFESHPRCPQRGRPRERAPGTRDPEGIMVVGVRRPGETRQTFDRESRKGRCSGGRAAQHSSHASATWEGPRASAETTPTR